MEVVSQLVKVSGDEPAEKPGAKAEVKADNEIYQDLVETLFAT